MAATDDAPLGALHVLLVRRGPELLVVLGLVLLGLGIGLDRDWLAGFGLVAVMLGVILPRMKGGPLKAGLTGFEGQLSDPSELLRGLVREKGRSRHLPAEALERAETKAEALTWPSASTFPGPSTFPQNVSSSQRRLSLGEKLNMRWLELVAEGIVSDEARREYRLTFVGPLSNEARNALDAADDVVLIGGHTVPGLESHTVIVNAASTTEAVNRVRNVLADYGSFGRWEAEPFDTPFGFFEDKDDENGPPDDGTDEGDDP
jgi:hypothetical protein